MLRHVLGCLLLAVLLSSDAFGLCSAGGVAREELEQGNSLVLNNGILRLEFERASGELLAVRNLPAELELFERGPGACALPILASSGKRSFRVKNFAYEVLRDDAELQSVRLTWTIGMRVEIILRVELAAGQPMAFFWPRVENGGNLSVRGLTFPNIAALATLGETSRDDVLVHAFTRGMKFLDPAHSLDLQHNPLELASYPQAYNGMTHQLVDYYEPGRGGFFFACFDPHSTEKTLEMPAKDGRLAMAWTFRSWDATEGASLDFDFPFVIGANLTGDWYGAADLYREWAESAPWCRDAGRLADRPETQRARWLLEDVGLATFGTSASRDQSAWFRAYHDILDGPVFHVLGHDTLAAQGRAGDPRDIEYELHPANRRAFESTGDPFAVFLADLKTSFLLPEIAHEVGRTTLSIVPRATPEGCPTVELWQLIHAARGASAVGEFGADSFYCDASGPNRNLSCFSEEHPHPVGRGRWMNEGFRDLYANTRRAMSEECGTYTPLGVELMHEGLIDRFDYYQARNGGGFMGGLEGGFYRGLQLRGLAESVPVFSYIYHEYAPVALDGCGKATEKIGDIFYWMAARVALAGGIFELNNEFAPPERFPGMDCVGILHYRLAREFDWVPMGARGNDAFDERKGAFLREIAAARTGYGKDFLAYGRMQPPLEFERETIELDYVYGNNIDWGGKPNTTNFADVRGKYRVDRVQHTAWSFENRLGFFFVNLGEEQLLLEVKLDLERYWPGRDVDMDAAQITVVSAGMRFGMNVTSDGTMSLPLPSRGVVLIEVSAAR